MPEPYYLSIAEAALMVRKGQLSPVDLTRAHLERIEQVDSRLHSYITVAAAVALTQAKQAAAGNQGGSLCGIPVSYKDLIATAGIRTTAASRVYENWIPDKDAYVVTRLRESGAVTLGKATLNEFAFSETTSDEDLVKPAQNPWNLSASTGLSSSGSAVAVAAGLAMASIATDSGGSIRMPASYCGVTGLKPTYGRIGRSGVVPLSYSCDHVGVITRSAEDSAILLAALAGLDPSDPASSGITPPSAAELLSKNLRGLRMGVCSSYMEAAGMESEVALAFRAALEVFRSLGAEVREIEIPHLSYAPSADFTILRVEGFNAHLQNLRDKREKYGASAFSEIAVGGFLSTVDYYRALQTRTLIADELHRAFQNMDALATPTTPGTGIAGTYTQPPKDRNVAKSDVAYLAPFNLTGSPAVSIPCGFTTAGMPVGLQLVGRAFDETTILSAAHQYQQVTDWHHRRPPL
jgi:aspartyl-tRNA(Asn)/glutamyl-tRNA(Gln) amidotransferase subunit A